MCSSKMTEQRGGKSTSVMPRRVGVRSKYGFNDRKPKSKKSKGYKPKRPLSAYNLFFQHERNKIISDPNIIAQVPEDLSPAARRQRIERKSHGKIGFADLARTIAQKWKAIDEETRALFEAKAATDLERYKKESSNWKKNKTADDSLKQQENQMKKDNPTSSLGDLARDENAFITPTPHMMQVFDGTEDSEYVFTNRCNTLHVRHNKGSTEHLESINDIAPTSSNSSNNFLGLNTEAAELSNGSVDTSYPYSTSMEPSSFGSPVDFPQLSLSLEPMAKERENYRKLSRRTKELLLSFPKSVGCTTSHGISATTVNQIRPQQIQNIVMMGKGQSSQYASDYHMNCTETSAMQENSERQAPASFQDIYSTLNDSNFCFGTKICDDQDGTSQEGNVARLNEQAACSLQELNSVLDNDDLNSILSL